LGWHVPFKHVSGLSQSLSAPLPQAMPLAAEALLTHPLAGSHESTVQALPSLQFGAGPPTQTPPEQTSFVVQALPSLHVFEFGTLSQKPPTQAGLVQGLASASGGQSPTPPGQGRPARHMSVTSLQFGVGVMQGFPVCAQTPSKHESSPLQNKSSSQSVPLGFGLD
jgi:hypothetical protein